MTWLVSPEFKVGMLVVIVGGLVGGMAMKVAEGPGIFSGSRKYHFTVDSAGGLVQNSAVKMAGIKVGVIDGIKLKDGKAEITVALDGDAQISKSSVAELKSDGILGDKHVEISPGQASDGLLPSGSELKTSGGAGGMDEVMANVNRVAKSLNELMDTLNHATKEGDSSTRLGRILENIEKVSADLRDVTGANKEKINEIVDRVRNLTKNLDTYINEDTLARVDHAVKNIDEITGKLNTGQGTLGRLINDDETVDKLNTAITKVNKFLGGADKMETSVDFHSEFLNAGQNKSYLGFRLQPGLDRYYELDVISDSHGVKRSESTDSTSDGVSHTSSQTITYQNKFKLTALFAKNFWDFTLKGGLIEDYGGVGVDYYLLGRDLRMSVEAFDFSALQLRAFARYNFFKGLYVTAGGDNLLSKDGGKSSAFVGAGLFITNDDLKMLATKISF